MDIEAEVLQTVDEALDVPSPGALVEVIGAEILVAGSVLEHVIDGGEQRGSDRANGFFGSAAGAQAMILRLKVAAFGAGRCPGALDQDRLQPGRPFPHAGGAAFAGTFIVAWT